MTSYSSLRTRLVGTVFLAITPAWALMYWKDLSWSGFLVGLFALVAAWLGGEFFVVRQVRRLLSTTQRLAGGDLSSRTGLSGQHGELGDLARQVDQLASKLEVRAREGEQAEHALMNRSLQQTVVSALGQFALVSTDFTALLEQVVMLVSQTLEVEYCDVFESRPAGKRLFLRAGVGWRPGLVGKLEVNPDAGTQLGHTLRAGEPLVVDNLKNETRFSPEQFLLEHGVFSSVTVEISGPGSDPFGVLGAHTSRQRSFSEDDIHFLLSVATVVAMAVKRAQAESQVRKLAAFTELNPDPAMELGPDGELSYYNPAATRLAAALDLENPRLFFPPEIRTIVEACLSSGQSRSHYQSKVGAKTLSWCFHPVPLSNVVHVYLEDITDRLQLEEQLRHSQKLESVGQLAAGVAHDFNNMLTVIQGHSGMMLARTGLPRDLMDSAQAVYFAAERATSLTRQLLMFSRKNVIQRQVLDLREVVSQMSKLLQRLLGETVRLECVRASELPFVNADAGMVEQVVMNLCVNARDAMPKGGPVKVSIEAMEVSAAHAQSQSEARPGSFVVLRVQDAGIGMSEATMKRIFEPFFTTKEVGKGTGLGLATVYGIARQHEGWVEVSSELGHGSEFRVFFPATDQMAPCKKQVDQAPTPAKGGRETILVVEDEEVLRDLAHMILETCGYEVLRAGSGPEALGVWKANHTRVDLVLTDMVMPDGMTGTELAHKLLAAKPELRVVVASGYSLEETDTARLPAGKVTFLQKPYTHLTLAKAVRESLDRRSPSTACQRNDRPAELAQ